MVPTMICMLLDHPRFGEFDLSSLETVFYGASAIAPARLKEAIERIGPVFFQFYGQAEAPMTITVLRKAEHHVNDMRRLASCGSGTVAAGRAARSRERAARAAWRARRDLRRALYSVEIEQIISQHSAVAGVAVIGVPDSTMGEEVKALIVLRPGTNVEDDELRALVKNEKDSSHKPRYVQRIDSIPLTPKGTADKKKLRELYGQP